MYTSLIKACLRLLYDSVAVVPCSVIDIQYDIHTITPRVELVEHETAQSMPT